MLASGLARFVGLGKESIWLDEATSIKLERLMREVIPWVMPLALSSLGWWWIYEPTHSALRPTSIPVSGGRATPSQLSSA